MTDTPQDVRKVRSPVPVHCRALLAMLVFIVSFAVTSVGCGPGDSLDTGSVPAEFDKGTGRSNASSISGAASTDLTRMQFVDRASEAGIRFTVRNGEEAGQFAILESLGAGVSLVDADADGQLDIIVPGGGEFAGAIPVGLPFGFFRQLEKWTFK
ncbi:MAG: hypothetical protein HQ518_22860 [Rhodopirellula sp.]|nr:hypothetical protein [Rhodopirellula sp.]